MTEIEGEMIYEINRVRHNPNSYIQYLQPMLNEAAVALKKNGKGEKNYSMTFSNTTKNGRTIEATDTTWHYTNQE